MTAPFLIVFRISLRFSLFLGLFLRAWHYFRTLSVWQDEAALIHNVLQLNSSEMFGPLLLDQAAPPLFLLLIRTVVHSFGDSVLVLRLVPFISACMAMILFTDLCRRSLRVEAARIAVLLFAVSDSLLWHASELKPYSSDVLMAVLVPWLVMRTNRFSISHSAGVGILLAPLCIWFSFPACFVFGGWLVALLPRFLSSSACARDRVAYLGFVLSVSISFILLALGPIHEQRTGELVDYWKSAFPDWQKPWFVPLWILLQTAEVIRYAIMPWGNFLAPLFAVGAWQLWRRDAQFRTLFLAILMPMLAVLVASLLGKYPYSASRLEAFLIGTVCITMGVGFVAVLEWCAQARIRHGLAWFMVLWLVAPCGFAIYQLLVPTVRPASDDVAKYILQERKPGELVLSNHWDYLYYLRAIPPEEKHFWFGGRTGSWGTISGQRVWIIHTNSIRPTKCPVEVPREYTITREIHFTMTTCYLAER